MSNQDFKDRRRREVIGRRAEVIASIWLGLKGYKIEKTRLRLKSGEIDIVATKNKTVVFVEVKARKTLDAGLRAVPDSAWMRISRTAEIWMSHTSRFQNYDWRYDLVVICPRKFPKHLKSFWRP